MRKLFTLLLILWPPLLLAQFTQVQGTITDPSGLPYANGTITPSLVISGSPRFASSGFGYTPPNQPVGLDSKGSFVMQLADVTQLLPPGGTWSFHTCSAAGTVQPGSPITQGPVCFDVTGIVVTGSVMDISTQLSAAAPKLTTGGAAAGVSSINGGTGAFTFTGSGVSCASGTCTFTDTNGTGPGTAGQFALYSGTSTVAGTPSLTFGPSSVVNVTNSINATQPIALAPTSQGLLCTGANSIIPTAGNPNPGQFGCLSIGTPAIQYTGNGGALRPITVVKTNGTYFTSNEVNFNGTVANPPVCTPGAPANGRCISFQFTGGQVSAALVGDGTTNCLNGQSNYVPCGAGAVALSGLTAATAGNTINNTDFQQTWTWALAGDVPGMVFGEFGPNTSVAQPLVQINTTNASLTTPLQLTQGQITGTTSVPMLNLNTTLNNASLSDNIIQVNATNTASSAPGTNFFLFNSGAAGNSLIARMDIAGTLYTAGPFVSTNIGSQTRICGSNLTSCNPNQAGGVGGVLIQGADNANATVSSRAGTAVFRGGVLTAASPSTSAMEGVTQIGMGMLGTSATFGNAVCMTTTSLTVADCSATGPAANVVGIATSTVNPIGVVIEGAVPVNLDNTAVIGDFVCRGTVTAGQNHDNGTTACAAGLGIGVVIAVAGTAGTMTGATTGTQVLSTSLPLVMLHIR